MSNRLRRRSSVKEAHAVYEKYHHFEDLAPSEHGAPPPLERTQQPFKQFHCVEKTGVIYATSRASSHGFTADDPEWANLGQGAPETGPLEGSPSRDFHLNIPDSELEYAPVAGVSRAKSGFLPYGK